MIYRLTLLFLVLGLVSAPGLAAPAPTALYHFDDARVVDSASGREGSLAAGAAIVPGGISGNCLRLNRASDSYASLGKAFPLTIPAFTISTWVKTTPGFSSPDAFFVGRHVSTVFAGYFLFVNTTSKYGAPGKASFYYSPESITSKKTINDGQWHHVAAVYREAGPCELYVDGLLEATGPSAKMKAVDVSTLVGGIHSADETPAGSVDGWVDELAFFNVALTAGEVAQLAQAPGASGATGVMRITLRSGKTMDVPLADIARVEFVSATPEK